MSEGPCVAGPFGVGAERMRIRQSHGLIEQGGRKLDDGVAPGKCQRRSRMMVSDSGSPLMVTG
jgi:hypothetical protein